MAVRVPRIILELALPVLLAQWVSGMISKSEPPLGEGTAMAGLGGWFRWKYFPAMCLAVWCVTGVLLRSGPSDTVLTSPDAQADFMVPVSGAWALASGMRIHTDFSTPLGPAYYLPYYWALEILGDKASVVRHVESGIFVAVSVISFLLLRPPRYSWGVTALGVCFLSLLGASPGMLGRPPTEIYEGIAYNYLGIVTGYLCLLTALFPPKGLSAEIKRREMGDALLLAAILVWITFVKVNFLVQNAAFLAVVLVVNRFNKSGPGVRFWGVLAGGFVLLALVFVLVFRVDLGGMWRDVQMAASCRSHYVFTKIALSDAFGQGAYLGLASLYMGAGRTLAAHQAELLLLAGALLGGMAVVTVSGGTSLRRLTAYCVLVLLVLVGDIFQGFFNTYNYALPMLPFMWFLVICVLERGGCICDGAPGEKTALLARNWVGGLAAVMAAWHILFLAAGHVSAFVFNSGLSDRFGKNLAGVEIHRDEFLRTEGWERLYYAATRGMRNTNSFVAKVNDGMALLQNTGLEQQRIFVMDQINPFPFLLRAPYPAGQPAWLHIMATFSKEKHLPVETVLKGADVIMVPKKPLNPPLPV